MKHNCPSCKKRIPWLEKRGFKCIKRFGFRNPFTCPHCGAMVIFSKWPYRMSETGIFIIAIQSLLLYVFKAERGGRMEWILGILGLLLIAVGFFSLKFEQVDSKKIPDTSDNTA